MTRDGEDSRRRFERAVRAAGGQGSVDDVFDDLVARHREPHRHYHTLTHVLACLKWLDRFAGLAEHAEEVELALWFHDAVYDPRAHDNERRSAELARAALAALGARAAAVTRVVGHIAATERHAAALPDSMLAVDIDLAILGAAPADFERFERQIQAEYAHVPPALFRAGRCGVLQGFLERPHIYQVSGIREALEIQARSNLTRRTLELVAADEREGHAPRR
jgi:predicted metal-dependent HD superfamily phosphohydrolase